MARAERRSSRTKLGRSKSAARARAPNTGRDVGRRPYEITVVVLGATKVGKSAIVSQFLWESFLTDYRPTVEEFNWVEYDVGDGSVLMLQIIDSSGSHDFLAMRHFYIRTGDAFMVVFSIDDPSSLEEAKRIIEEIEEERHKTVPIVLVANKRDLEDDVTKWEAKGSHQYAYSRTIPIIECTAKRHNEVQSASSIEWYSGRRDAINFVSPTVLLGSIDEATEAFKELLERLRDQNRIGMTEMTKRRQSMPSTRAYSGIDVADVERLKGKNKSSCVIC